LGAGRLPNQIAVLCFGVGEGWGSSRMPSSDMLGQNSGDWKKSAMEVPVEPQTAFNTEHILM